MEDYKDPWYVPVLEFIANTPYALWDHLCEYSPLYVIVGLIAGVCGVFGYYINQDMVYNRAATGACNSGSAVPCAQYIRDNTDYNFQRTLMLDFKLKTGRELTKEEIDHAD